MKNPFFIVSAVIFLTLVLFALFLSRCESGWCMVFESQKIDAVNSFEKCEALGFPVMESYPRQCRAGDKSFVENVTPKENPEKPISVPVENSMIRVTEPLSNQKVESPLRVTGEARGNWYFEASFPVSLIDGNGKELGRVPAQAKGEWMTTEFVPFEALLTFEKPTTEMGMLILEKDNPSGLPENAAEIRVPVNFSTTQTEERDVKLYYYNAEKDKDQNGQILCSKQGLVAVDRKIPVTLSPMQDTLKLLIQGRLTQEEKAQGITTEYPLPGFILRGIAVDDGLLLLMFADPQNKTNGGSCRVNVLKAQIEETARQFIDAKEMRFKPDTLFQP